MLFILSLQVQAHMWRHYSQCSQPRGSALECHHFVSDSGCSGEKRRCSRLNPIVRLAIPDYSHVDLHRCMLRPTLTHTCTKAHTCIHACTYIHLHAHLHTHVHNAHACIINAPTHPRHMASWYDLRWSYQDAMIWPSNVISWHSVRT